MIIKWISKSAILIAMLGLVLSSKAQNKTVNDECVAVLKNEILTLENSKISRIYKWNNGNIITLSLTDKVSGKVWQINSKKPDLIFPGQTQKADNAVFISRIIPANSITPEHLEAEIIYTLGNLQIKRVFRIYPGCAAIACDFYYKGESNSKWTQESTNLSDLSNLEKLTASNSENNVPVIEKLELPGKHWKLEAVEFCDVTDRNNTLVFSVKSLSYKPNFFKGNLLFAKDNVTENGVFMLKEAPTSNVQLAYSGSDFITDFGTLKVVGAGIQPADLNPNEWCRGYGFVTGVYSGDDNNKYVNLRDYQKRVRIHQPGRDEMILMNTWGDRGQDKKVNESFCLAELEAGAKLGITHFQLDDGWQSGRSSNSAFAGGSLDDIWKTGNYWKPNPEKFPNGLTGIIEKGRKLGIQICLWFNPSSDNSNENWEKDANTLIHLYKEYGIQTFKIDGVKLPNKLAEINFRKFLDKVNLETDNHVVFNLDVTAGRRGGYNYFNEYGNLFLENRYTDWQNYYPYTTLRNIWMLSKYIPSQNLQIEFLNKWRNSEKYGDDPFAPAHYSFDFLFAITMAAQPLAWFEATGLPEEAFLVAGPVIHKYRAIQNDFHSGNIFPIGDEPSGKSWTGFQSIQNGKGYFLVYRESNDMMKATLNTWLPTGTHILCKPVIGKGKAFSATTGIDGRVTFQLPEKNSFVLYHYSIK